MPSAKVFFGAAAEYYRRLIGGDVEPIKDTKAVGTTPSVLVAADPERVQLTIVNLSSNSIYIMPNDAPTTSSGIFLSANGGSVSMNVHEDGTLPAQEWRAVATAANSSVQIIGLRRFNQEA